MCQIDATDKQIDDLVYELYGLSEEEIRVVEGGLSCRRGLILACKIMTQSSPAKNHHNLVNNVT